MKPLEDSTGRADPQSPFEPTEPSRAAEPDRATDPVPSPEPAPGLRHGLRALRHRNFRLFFLGALASNSGSWLQNLTVPYVLFELSGRSLWVGLAGFAQFFPVFLVGPIGGMLADRYDRRVVLLTNQALMAVAAFLLWGAWVAGWRSPYLILGLTALSGILAGLMIPSWQAFVPALVPKADLPSAITLNSTQFNASRAIGPALAGILLATAGPSWAFLGNGLSFVAVIGVLWVVRPIATDRAPGPSLGVLAGFGSALRYIRLRTGIVLGIGTAMLVGFFGSPTVQFTVVFGEEVFQAGPRVVGILASAIGFGAVLVAPFLSSWDGRIARSSVVRWGLPLYGLAVLAFALSPHWALALVALLAVGGGFLSLVATTNTAVQMIVTDSMRGRVMGVRIMGFTASYPLGALLQGAMADVVGPRVAVGSAGMILIVVGLGLASRPGLLRSLNRNDDHPDRPPRPGPSATAVLGS